MGDVSINTPMSKNSGPNDGVAVYAMPKVTDILDLPFLKAISTETLGADTVVDSRVIQMSAPTAFSVGKIAEVANGSNTFYQGRILSILGSSVTLDLPMNHAFLNGSSVFESEDNLIIDGTIDDPAIFTILPLPGQSGLFTRLMITINSDTAQDDSKFGADDALPIGIAIRIKNSANEYLNLFNFKTNGQFVERSFDGRYVTNTGNNTRTFSSRRTYGGEDKNDTSIELVGNDLQQVQALVYDNLTLNTGGGVTANNTLRLFLQGRVFEREDE